MGGDDTLGGGIEHVADSLDGGDGFDVCLDGEQKTNCEGG